MTEEESDSTSGFSEKAHYSEELLSDTQLSSGFNNTFPGAPDRARQRTAEDLFEPEKRVQLFD